MLIMQELRKMAASYPRKAQPIPIVINGVGQVGHVANSQGVYINSAMRRSVASILRDHYRIERLAREATNGRFGADEMLAAATLGSDSRDAVKAIRAVKSMMMSIISWDGVVNARATGNYFDMMGTKASQTTVANSWFSFLRTAGTPAAMAFSAQPGPAGFDSTTTGAWPIGMTLGGAEDLYLTNIGTNHATGTNIVLAVDVLQGVGNVSVTAAANATQSVNTSLNKRYSGGAGVMMTLEVTTALGGTASNVTISYTDESGNAAGTGAIALLTSGIVGGLVPVRDGALIRLASGDYGVRSVQNLYSSASMGTGNVGLIMYKPLIVFPTLSTTTFVERSTPAQIGGIKRLTDVAGGSMPCIGFLVNTSTTSTGVQTYLTEMVKG